MDEMVLTEELYPKQVDLVELVEEVRVEMVELLRLPLDWPGWPDT